MRFHVPAATWWIVAILALAGCTDRPSDAGTTPEGPPPSAIEVPTWSVGDHWIYRTLGPDGQAGSVTIVVTAEEGGDYVVDTNERTTAYFHATDEISYLGKVRKADLAGSQGSDRVQYFEFPLEVGKTWTTPWDGERVSVEVKHVEAGEAHMEATLGGTLFADYRYADGFLGSIQFHDENGTPTYLMELDGQGSDFTGTVYRYALEEPLRFSATEAQLQSAVVPLGDDINEIGIAASGTCGGAQAGSMGAVLTEREPDDPHVPHFIVAADEPVYAFQLDCRTDQDGTDEAVDPVDATKAYHLDIGTAAPGSRIEVDIEPRTLTSIAVG